MGATVISIINNKGGVGKTTSTGIIAEIFAYLDKRVLVVDLDGQSNITMLFNRFKEDSRDVITGIIPPEEENIAELMLRRYREKDKVASIIKDTNINGIDIIPSSKRHEKTADRLMIAQTGNNNIILKKALDTVKEDYDFILIDNGPRSDILTVNSMFASDFILVPVRVEEYSYKGLAETMNDIFYIKDEHGLDNPELLGVFITQAELNTKACKNMRNEYESELNEKFFKTLIRKDTKISDMNSSLKPILELAPNTNAVFDYCELILEMRILDDEANTVLKKTIGK